MLAPLDYLILLGYLGGLLVIGLLLAKRAGQGDSDYFLGGRNIPWWALGASGMSSNLDVAGTTAIIALIYHFGLHGFFIEFRGGVVLPIAVWLAFMGKWHRRSGVTTTGEWMLQRFGQTAGGAAARTTAALTYLVITVGMVFFFLSAAGGFLAEFWPGTPTTAEIRQLEGEIETLQADAGAGLTLDETKTVADRSPDVPVTAEQAAVGGEIVAKQKDLAALKAERSSHERWLAIGMALLALVYTAAAGLYGVVWTDVFQAFIIGAAAIYTSVVAFDLVTPELLAQWPGSEFNTAYPQLYNANLDKSDVPGLGNYSLFGLFLIYFLGKGLIEGLGGSGGSAYMAQRFYAAKDDAATRKLSMLWAILFTFRWPMVLGLALIAVKIGSGDEDVGVLLPNVLKSEYFPTGLRGLMIAALFAASMSTFDSTINAGASYLVKDVYLPASPYATPKQQVFAGYVASALIVAVGLTLTLLFPAGVLEIWRGIVLLFSAFLVPFALRWFWPRMTGGGFTIGVASGFLALVVIKFMGFGANYLNEATEFFAYAGASFVGCIVGSLITRPVETSTLMSFYRQTRPLGPWPREYAGASATRTVRAGGTLDYRSPDTTTGNDNPDRVEHRNDWLRLGVAVLWQIFTFLLPMLALLKMWPSFIAVGLPWLGLTVALWRDARHTPGDDVAAR